MALRKFIIERDIPAVGSFEREQLRGARQIERGACPARPRYPMGRELCGRR
jgi:hypothetical protein